MSKKLLLKGMVFSAVLLGGVFASEQVAKAEEWAPRSVEQIKNDITGNEYTIVWGDTLSAISQATNISVEKLASWNSISNVDLIFAGNKLVFNGDVVSVQDNSGNVVSQSVIKPEDKNDATKPVGGSNQANSGTQVSNTENTGNGNSVNEQDNSGNNTPSTPSDNGGDNGNGSGNVTSNPQPTPTPDPQPNPDPAPTPEPTPDPQPNPDPEPTPDPQPEKKWTVWYTGENDSSHDIAYGSKLFGTEEEAKAWIDAYADDLLAKGITSSHYGAGTVE